MRSKCPGVNKRFPSFLLVSSMAFIIVGYVLKIILDNSGSSLFSHRLHVVKEGRRFTKLFLACLTNAVRSARNKIFFAQSALVNTSTKLIATRVLPLPVAITSKALRLPFSKSSHVLTMASF